MHVEGKAGGRSQDPVTHTRAQVYKLILNSLNTLTAHHPPPPPHALCDLHMKNILYELLIFLDYNRHIKIYYNVSNLLIIII